ncbi:type II toxin-antitoxin system RelE/ParE family toxin [Pseudonocardia thermophila]|nr:hypothetical protein [Pseudonocardia thermophila]
MSFAYIGGGGGTWDWYVEGGLKLAIEEIRRHAAAIAATSGDLAAADFLALIRAKLKRAERGELEVPDDGKPHLHLRPGVMEIRWHIEGTNWRLYYCEPLELRLSRVMLGLLFNVKTSPEQQDADITAAAHRWSCWQAQRRG